MNAANKTMNTANKVIYTDGDQVTVTDSTFHVHRNNYRLDGIIRYGLYVMRPSRLPAIIAVLIGLALMIVGFGGWFPADLVPSFYLGEILVGPNMLAMGVGGIIALAGVIAIGLLRDRYAVRISTAEGEKNVVVSSRKEYIAQIVDALTTSHYGFRPRSVMPSGT